MIVRENSDELTLRAEEVVTSKELVNVNHIERWCLPQVDADWYAFCQALYKGIEGEVWEEMYESYKEMSKAVERQPRMQEKNTTTREKKDKLSTLEKHLKDPIVALDRALKCVEKWF